jgi:hypothetical protein
MKHVTFQRTLEGEAAEAEAYTLEQMRTDAHRQSQMYRESVKDKRQQRREDADDYDDVEVHYER